ncbi:MAG: hypothetical protein IT425_06980 [Pirellulales bacterium]|nr:hypothetical protein [Pirellulales bacterium]
MSELLQEFVTSTSERLRVDRAAGVIRGVKLLGLASRNGRRYCEGALQEAIGLYEGAKVNVNHPKGHPLTPRDYQDRLGVVRGVQFRAGEGLFGDLHYNPRHALSEQLVWDAEHAPQNVGMSHNVLARTKQVDGETIVETITKVQSIDLVADPATTSGLYEQEGSQERRDKSQEPVKGTARPALDSQLLSLDLLTLEELRLHRPDLVGEIERFREEEFTKVRRALDEATSCAAAAKRRSRALELLQEHGLPLPGGEGDPTRSLVSPQFFESLMMAADDAQLEQLVEERAALVKSASRWAESGPAHVGRPKAKGQHAIFAATQLPPVRTAAEFAAALRSC